jgi:hypothetical protein
VYYFGAEGRTFARGTARDGNGTVSSPKGGMRMSVYEAFMLVIEIAALVVAVLSYIRSAKDDRKRK